MISFLLHVFGIDNVSGRWYAFWSGVGGDLTFFTVPVLLWRRHNCHVKGCWRIGTHPSGEHVLCHKHHPVGQIAKGDL